MAPNPIIMQAVERLGYCVTVGDVAARSGLNVNQAQAGLLALASEAGGHLQVAETGDIVYLFPQNFREIVRNKFLRLRLKEWWDKIWGILFYLIRISFGLVLLLSILLIYVAIIAIALSALSSSDSDGGGDSSDGGGWFWFPDFFWFFDPYYSDRTQRQQIVTGEPKQLNFLEAVFSFLFGDGNPNADLEARCWQDIATVISNNQGAVAAAQIAPYLDEIERGDREYENYMLPVLTRFNGLPEVSPDGDIVYHFPDLQTMAQERNSEPVGAYLHERRWRFSAASSGQVFLACGLGAVNIIGALVLGSLLKGQIAAGFVGFVGSILGLLLAYGVSFLTIPLIRYFWIQMRNSKIEAKNQQRLERASELNQAHPALQKKIDYAQQFAAQTIITRKDLAYTTETNLLEQEVERALKSDDGNMPIL